MPANKVIEKLNNSFVDYENYDKIKEIINNLNEAIATGNPFLEQFGLENKKWILQN